MRKNISIIIVFVSLVLGIYTYQIDTSIINASELENKIDLLIQNKEIQKNLNLQIKKLEEEIISIHKENNNNENEVEVITVSFIDNTTLGKEDIENIKLDSLIKNKEELEYKLQEELIEGVKLEKQIRAEKLEEVKLNGNEYILVIWPVNDYTNIRSQFGERIHTISGNQSFHKGIDIPAPQDTDILACDDGIVLFSGVMNGYGNVVKLKHFDDKITLYAHNNSNIVEEGDIIKSGQVIAKVGTTGNSTGNHLHFESIINEQNINPIKVINK